MALAKAEECSYGQAVDPRNLKVGQRVIAVEVYFKTGAHGIDPIIAEREICGTVRGIPAEDSDSGYVHIQPGPEDGRGSATIHVLGIARAAAIYNREMVESAVLFYAQDPRLS